MSKEHLHRYCVGFAFRYNNKEFTGIEKFETALLNTDSKRLTYSNLIGQLTQQQLDAVAVKYEKNPPAHPDDPMLK